MKSCDQGWECVSRRVFLGRSHWKLTGLRPWSLVFDWAFTEDLTFGLKLTRETCLARLGYPCFGCASTII